MHTKRARSRTRSSESFGRTHSESETLTQDSARRVRKQHSNDQDTNSQESDRIVGPIDGESSSRRVSVYELFRFASSFDKLLMLIGAIMAVVDGAGPAVMTIIFGGMADKLMIAIKKDLEKSPSSNSSIQSPGNPNQSGSQPLGFTPEEFEASVSTFVLYYLALGVVIYAASVVQITCWQIVCERISHRMRQTFMRSVLRQELSWYDKNQSGSLSSKLNDDIERVRDGLGEQFGTFIKQTSSFLSGFFIGFLVSWRLTLVMLSVSPILAGFSAFIGRMLATSTKREQEKYAAAGAIAEEVLTAIRTVFALGGQQSEISKYKCKLEEGEAMARTKYLKLCTSFGFSTFVLYSAYGLALYVGALLVDKGQLSTGSAMSVIMAVMVGSGALGNILPPLQTISMALSSAALIYEIIDSVPPIDPYSDRGLRLSKVMANIKFENVSFSYPTRRQVPVLKQLNLDMQQGKTMAICGRTGSGKSTIINMLLRLYDPAEGAVYLDNCNLRDLNVAWLRSLMGIVEQEPALFDCSIRDNIALGSSRESDATRERIVAVAKLAMAHDFIMNLPEGYDTRCGDRGVQMSGGQKQRIAIARALLSDPKVLLLDEATSALDSESEAQVQQAINKACQGRTTVIIAHRLSTIRNADVICVLDGGRLVEMGKHEELMAKRGEYFDLVTNQVFYDKSDEDEDDKLKSSAMTDDELRAIEHSQSPGAQSSAGGGGGSKSGSRMAVDAQRSTKSQASISQASMQSTTSLAPKSSYSTTLYESINRPFKSSTDYKNGHTDEAGETASFSDLVKLMGPEKGLLIMTTVMSALSGTLLPTFGLFYAQILDTLNRTGEELFEYASFWSIMFVLLGLLFFILMSSRVYLGAITIERCLSRIRAECFANIMRQHVGWFDISSNSPQRLTTRLAADAPSIKAVFNARFISLISGLSTIMTAMIIAFCIGWQLAILLTVALPVLIYVGYIQTLLMRGNKAAQMRKLEDASRLATEAIEHVKIIQAIHKQSYFCDRFNSELEGPLNDGIKSARKLGFVYGISQSCIYFVYAAAFRWGAHLVAGGQMDVLDVFRVFFAVAFTAVAVGQWGGFSGDIHRAYESIARIIRVLSAKTSIDSLGRGGIKPKLKGTITMKDVHFSYPSRPDTPVLYGINLTIKPGQTLALVGSSGSGKSTITALLLRFYDPDRGTIYVGDFDIRCINLNHLRFNIGLVSQEPCLFKASIRDNILYGLDRSKYSTRDVVHAAKLANIHDFIMGLPQGYDTQVGERGAQMSGGQKQRIAIARTMIRNPTILILDEATSALDAESEALVTEALDKASKGKTCIKIAHRLSTVRDADQIAVIDRGQVVELGTHDNLMALGKKGYYFKLMQKQQVTN